MKKLLNDIYYEQKATNRQLQRLSNIALIGILMWLSKNAKDKGDELGKKLCKAGLALAIVAEGVLMVSDIWDYRSKSISKQLIEVEEKKDM
ncbi:MAG: hypothetical protein IJD40_11870 [Lachnospiraceae bacterium]|nr:hypothetical protein [Lachnospiraceae bacterium]